MKTLKFVLIPVLISLLLFGCKAEPLDGDEDAPVIEVLAPSDNPVFYVSGSQSTPTTLQIRARATDNNAVVFGILTIEDANGDLVDADVESSFSENNTVMELLANFSTDTPGTYKLNFLFRDANDNNASVTRTVECLAGTDEQAEEEEEEEPTNDITFQFFASDKKNETVLRIDVYEDGHSANLITNQVIDAKGMRFYPDQEELLFGSTLAGLNVEIFSTDMEGKNLNSTTVSNANFLFSTLAKDYDKQEIYYFLEGADLTKVPRHALYRMDADGTNQTMIAQIDNATRENAIQKMLLYDNNGSPILIMHDRTTLYVYNPGGEGSWESSAVFSQDSIEIHDIAMGADNKTVYMVLKYGNYYNVGTTTIEGSETNVSLVHIPENQPAASDNLPHRIKVDVENQHIYWFTQSEDRQKSILKRANFNDTEVQTMWETTTCLCDGEVEEIRIEDYQINTGEIIVATN
ncbi:hypothetical protein [Flagellimonas nanhaiensis]|uniref:DUF4625 domain-containing protein n=1 Tax=Flagellimonas nanhaiensis TaxID=2292706 RepID=A0A371JSL5_9FLAO|nr:hypothetical protein [Allomuricauda nanhaiensis]RDY60791.1 hypothetical protein DX873_01005 [Allomuricauda nanhaiensis]